MDLSSFTTIVFILFGIVGAYLIFSNQVEGRAKIVLIVAVLIVFIVIFMNLSIFKSYSEGSDSPKNAHIETSITSYNPSSSYSISLWMYINDWNDKLGATKNLCKRTLTQGTSPNIYLDSYKNQVKIEFMTIPKSGDGSTGDLEGPIVIQDISIQKWVNLVVCFDSNKVDTYVNGKLVNTTISSNPQATPPVNGDSPPEFTFGNGFTGYLSNTRYYPRFLSPQEVWSIYSGGFSNNLLGNFLNQYNAAFIFYENQNEKAKFYLM
jgi:hypothetical protein